MKVRDYEIANPDVNNTRTVRRQQDTMGEIRVFSDDRQRIACGVLPDFCVGPLRANVMYELVIGSRPERQPAWQVGVDERPAIKPIA
jgi:hypothetical protein